MINQLKEAVELLQDPSRVNMESEDLELSGVQLYPVEMVLVEESLNGQDSDEGSTTPKAEDRAPASSHAFPSPPFGLKPRSAPPSLPCSPPPCLRPLLTQSLSVDSDTPPRPDDGGMLSRVFLRTHKSLESVDPQFTMRRKMEQLREELELMEQLRDSIESRLKVSLPEDLGSSLMDGVVLCHLANHIRPRSVASIHVPSPAVPKLSMAKCRRNVENFLDACRKMGVPQDKLCLPHHILEEKGMVKLSMTVQALVDETSTKQALFT
ncbi:leucine-rich repeat and calponin homology domain-containing protein 1 isoform X1 [Hypomesus transpacificus]|uniref:leucine-rich repeat and calponin homology domain-containing protein 1 isoform X1 n=1 Tax=Hypomesus transpacificus TaxID=137520 RepID=UPI001F084C06|nr:leucine-rich repeat and calponin homology domain-containing protein 1 isoform X1 [Hypomesus transpacificus]